MDSPPSRTSNRTIPRLGMSTFLAFLPTCPPHRPRPTLRNHSRSVCSRRTNVALLTAQTAGSLQEITPIMLNSPNALNICTPTLKHFLLSWADLNPLLLVSLVLTVGGIDPWRRVWGHHPLRNFLLVLFMAANISFSTTRYILEGLCSTIGPRQFLFMSVAYSARYIWLYLGITRAGRRALKAFEVACALRELKKIKLGQSTAKERLRELELVIRRGAREAKGELYWGGVVESIEKVKNMWMVRLVEQELHADLLDEIGTMEFKKRIETEGRDLLYRKFYEVVKTVDTDEGLVDYGGFLEEFKGVSPDCGQAQRVGAVDESALGDVARKIAKDACYYIWHDVAEFRTKWHVEKINECVEDAARRVLTGATGIPTIVQNWCI